jgi:hypothetical protein
VKGKRLSCLRRGTKSGVQGLVRNGLAAGFSATSSAIRHLGWWIDWHTRARPTAASKAVDEVPQALDATRAA